MDPPQQNQQFPSSNNVPQGGPNYPFNGSQGDPFNAFVNTDDSANFDASWTAPSFPNHQPGINSFDPGTARGWSQSSYQNPSLIPMPSYGAQPRDYDQSYPRNPAPFNNYSAFEPTQSYATTGFDNALDFDQLPISDRFEFPTGGHYAQTNETVSPQALQAYPSGSQNNLQQNRQHPSQTFEPSLSARTPLPNQPLSQQDWTNLSLPKTNSINRGGLHIKPTDAFSHATNSSRLDGFIFVGKVPVSLNASQVPVPRHKRRKSRNEVSRLLQREKGDDRWHPDRGPTLKKLKIAATKMSGPSATPSRSTADSASDSSDSESDDESEYSDSELEIEAEEPSPVPPTRPADTNKAVEYDILKAVWARRRTVLSGTVIRSALTQSWNTFLGIRDTWKKKTLTVQQAIEKKDTANKSVFERRVVDQRRLLESCIRLTLKHGHPSIVEKLGENPQLLAVFYQFLADRIKDTDYTGSFINSILELTARCTSVDTILLAKTKMDKVLPRFVKRGDEQGRALAQQILDHAASARPQRALSVDPAASTIKMSNGTAKIPNAGPAGSPKAQVATTKALGGNVDNKASKPSATNKSIQSNGDNDVSKAKTSQPVVKPSGFFAGLQSASKKPGTSTKSREGRPSIETDTKPVETKAPPKPAFSFAATMANLQKQKEAPATKIEDVRKPETPEEKQRRIRKESRRKLRVSFKADHELVQVKEFVHDPDEELGHEDSQMRDVGDSKGEGQMLKLHKDLDLMDEDEDYEPPEEIEPMPPWNTPQAIDFSDIDASELERNYVSRGGMIKVDSQERKIQEQRDSSTLMVVYTSVSDIPSTPREPPNEDLEERTKEEKFGEPDFLVKSREAEYRARASYSPTTNAVPPPANIANILAILKPQNKDQPPAPIHQQPQAMATPPSALLTNLLAQLGSSSNNQQSAPLFPTGQAQQLTAPNPNLQATLASIMQSSQSQQPYQPQQSFGAPQSTSSVPDIAAILAQVNGGQAQASQPPPMQGFGLNPNSNPDFNPYAGENDRKRQFDGDDRDDEHGNGKKARGDNGSEKRRFYGKPSLPCKFFQEGKCRKGDECTYIHE